MTGERFGGEFVVFKADCQGRGVVGPVDERVDIVYVDFCLYECVGYFFDFSRADQFYSDEVAHNE